MKLWVKMLRCFLTKEGKSRLIQRERATAVDLKNMHMRVVSQVLFGGKMRTIAQETAFQIALKNCTKEVGGKVSIHVILVKGEYVQSSTYFL